MFGVQCRTLCTEYRGRKKVMESSDNVNLIVEFARRIADA